MTLTNATLISFENFQISSVTSMSFLTDKNLTFHRFADGTVSSNEDKSKTIPNANESVWTTSTTLDFSTTNPTLNANESSTSKTTILRDDSINKRFSTYSSTFDNSVANSRNATHNGSTMKLIQVHKEDTNDSSSKQVRRKQTTPTQYCKSEEANTVKIFAD
jgi:hypothetical protein